jgi:predicted amidophosphoribosyltransferase
VLDLLLPRRCVVCAAPRTLLCDHCRDALPRLTPPLCERCGAPTAWPVARCRGCAGRRIPFASARSAFRYTELVRTFVSAWKEQGLRRLAQQAADLTCGLLEPPSVDVIVPAPPDWGRLLRRGHHPPAELAEALGRRWELPCSPLLERTRAAPRQAELHRDERRRNVRGAFAARAEPPASVLLVDDVYTTGATAAACALALRRAGADHVHVVTFARAVR